MNIIVNDNSDLSVNKPSIENIEKEKQEYYLLGEFLRTRGLKLFGYNHFEDNVFEVIIQVGNTIHLIPTDNGLQPIDFKMEKCMVDSRFIYFEALNITNAKKRVMKYKKDKSFPLCNLKKLNVDGINIFNSL